MLYQNRLSLGLERAITLDSCLRKGEKDSLNNQPHLPNPHFPPLLSFHARLFERFPLRAREVSLFVCPLAGCAVARKGTCRRARRHGRRFLAIVAGVVGAVVGEDPADAGEGLLDGAEQAADGVEFFVLHACAVDCVGGGWLLLLLLMLLLAGRGRLMGAALACGTFTRRQALAVHGVARCDFWSAWG
jgi:hypothetical protein